MNVDICIRSVACLGPYFLFSGFVASTFKNFSAEQVPKTDRKIRRSLSETSFILRILLAASSFLRKS